MGHQGTGLHRADAESGRKPWEMRAQARRRPDDPAQTRLVSALVGRVYEPSPAPQRARLLEALLRSGSVYALMPVAGGAFARLRGRDAAWRDFRLTAEDVRPIGTDAVQALAQRVLPLHPPVIADLLRAVDAVPFLARPAAADELRAALAR